ncbi:MAG: extracellular substrate binding-like orphan protein GrrP [Synechococcus sp.]
MRSRIVPALGTLIGMAALLPAPGTAQPAGRELRAVVFDASLPFLQKQGDTYEGLAVDVLKAIQDEFGASGLRFLPATSVDDGLQAITSGRADIACGVAFSWERSLRVLYTLPFAIGGTRVLAPPGVDGTPDSLNGRTVGVVENSAAAQLMASVVPGARLKTFRTPAEALAALRENRVPILAGSSLWLASNRSGSGRELVPAIPYGRTGIGCMVSQSNPRLLTAGNLAIAQMMQAYVDGDPGSREMVDRWVGPSSAVNLTEEQISGFYSLILTTTAEISTTVTGPDSQGSP